MVEIGAIASRKIMIKSRYLKIGIYLFSFSVIPKSLSVIMNVSTAEMEKKGINLQIT